MRLRLRKRMSNRLRTRTKAKVRIRKKIEGVSECPRLSVFRSCKHMYAQLIDDALGKVLVASSSKGLNLKVTSNTQAAKVVGEKLAQLAQSKNISKVVFDRNGYVYHGRVKALAEGAREVGLKF